MLSKYYNEKRFFSRPARKMAATIQSRSIALRSRRVTVQDPEVRSSWFARYVLPGFILKAAIIGGGYVSGRELEQYFSHQGPLGGLVGMGVATVVWSCVYAATLEFARVHRSYDYRTFFKSLLGPGWVVFEIAYLVMILTGLSVFTSVAGNIFHNVTGWPLLSCEAVFMATVALLLFFGTRLVESFLSLWSFVLYAAFAALVVLSFTRFGDLIAHNVRASPLIDLDAVFVQGIKYAGYNIASMAAVLFCARHIHTRKDAIIGGLLGGPLAMVPGMLFFLALAAFDPEIRTQAVPVEYLLARLDIPAFRLAFLIVMAVTLLGTCCALIHALNERVAQQLHVAGRRFPAWARAAIAAAIMVAAVFVADRVGLVALVDKGYGFMAWIFIATFLIPILTYGVWRIARAQRLVPENAAHGL
jgi:uncharacterized membrane protein YkvI